jgi:uncharacterized OsmC-like protein
MLFEVSTPAPDEKVRKLIELTERYCVVLQTLQTPARVVVQTSRP